MIFLFKAIFFQFSLDDFGGRIFVFNSDSQASIQAHKLNGNQVIKSA